MKLGWVKQRETLLLILLGIVVAAGAVYFLHKRQTNQANVGTAVSNKSIYETQKTQADKMLDNKNYEQAQQNYIAAATAQQLQNNLKGALATLQEGESKIPEQNLSWAYYDTTVAIAKLAGNKQAEIDNLKKAKAKAQQPNSGVPQNTIDTYNNRLKELGAS